MSPAYKEDEKALKKIIKENVKATEADTEVKLIVYYKTKRTSSLVMRNSCLPPTSVLQEVGLVYEYKCTIGDCSHLNSTYIGSTTTTLSKRISAHLQGGAIQRHTAEKHRSTLSRKQMEDSTTILSREAEKGRLRMEEAVYIYMNKPSINIQQLPSVSLPSQRRDQVRSTAPPTPMLIG